MATRKSGKRVSKKPGRRKTTPSRTLNDILIDLGRQALVDGVREVLEEHGIDSSVKIEMALTKAKVARKKTAAKRAKKRATKRRYSF